ncbi:MAG: SsrA-binding protein SmpB [Ilumatobacteraceae bacterium]|nr:SsrA-binding protein SmpB [Ilumatobacteraceae bacterium]
MAKHKRIKRKGSGDGTTLIASNKRARRDYDILDTYEAGLMLTGSEVKSLREGNAQIGEGYGRIEHGEAWLDGTHIPPYTNAIGFGAHDPDRRRKLLLHRAEIEKLDVRTAQGGLTIVPLRLYWKEGRAKIELALARGRSKGDKRQRMAERDADMEIDEATRRFSRQM